MLYARYMSIGLFHNKILSFTLVFIRQGTPGATLTQGAWIILIFIEASKAMLHVKYLNSIVVSLNMT
jgi:hypothetical protein